MGSVTCICSDKTGTLTSGQMHVMRLWCGAGKDGGVVASGGEDGAGVMLGEGQRRDMQYGDRLVEDLCRRRLAGDYLWSLACGLVVNTSQKSQLVYAPDGSVQARLGNDTETALLQLADCVLQALAQGGSARGAVPLQAGGGHASIRSMFPPHDTGRRVFAFSSTLKRMSTCVGWHVGDATDRIDSEDTGQRLFCKGAVEEVLERCVRVCNSRLPGEAAAGAVPLTQDKRREILALVQGWATEGWRALAVASRDLTHRQVACMAREEAEDDMTLVALVAIADPLRPDVREALRHCSGAGIAVKMLTGDSVDTAVAVAKHAGILAAAYSHPPSPLPPVRGSPPSGAAAAAWRRRRDGEAWQVMTGRELREMVLAEDASLDQDEFDKVSSARPCLHLRANARTDLQCRRLRHSGLMHTLARSGRRCGWWRAARPWTSCCL